LAPLARGLRGVIVLVVVLALVIVFPAFDYEDENENDDEDDPHGLRRVRRRAGLTRGPHLPMVAGALSGRSTKPSRPLDFLSD
jgi:hypothetical protein